MRRTGSEQVPLAMAAVGTAGAMVVSYVPAVREDVTRHPSTCLFRQLTGYRCPFCGMTHAVIDLLHGNLAAAAGHDAVVFILVLAVAVAFVGRVPMGRGLLDRVKRRLSFVGPGSGAILAALYSVARDVI